MTLTSSQFDDFENLAWDIGGEVYENYSGRGMFGKTCLAITVDELENALFRLGRIFCLTSCGGLNCLV